MSPASWDWDDWSTGRSILANSKDPVFLNIIPVVGSTLLIHIMGITAATGGGLPSAITWRNRNAERWLKAAENSEFTLTLRADDCNTGSWTCSSIESQTIKAAIITIGRKKHCASFDDNEETEEPWISIPETRHFRARDGGFSQLV